MARLLENTDVPTSLQHSHAAVYCVPKDTFLPRTLGPSLNYDRTLRTVGQRITMPTVRPRTDCSRWRSPRRSTRLAGGIISRGELLTPSSLRFLKAMTPRRVSS